MLDTAPMPRGRQPYPESAKVAWRKYRRPEYVAPLALALGTSKAAISKWKQVPESRLDVVSAMLGVPKELLRPDLAPLWSRTLSIETYLQSTEGKP